MKGGQTFTQTLAQGIAWTGTNLCLSLTPVQSHNSWQDKSSKCAIESTATWVSGNWMTIRQCVEAACLAWGSNRVSASSWSEHKLGSMVTEPWVRDTVLDISMNPPAKKTFCEVLKRSGSCWLKALQRNVAKFSLFLGLEINFVLCFRTGVHPPWIFTSRELDSALCCVRLLW